MKRIAYIMLDWGWIKQRPHFIAEMLSDDFQVDVFYRKANKVRKKDLPNEKPVEKTNLSIKGFRYLPFESIPFIKKLNLKFLNRLNIRRQLPSLADYDYVWITEPTQIEYIEPMLKPKNKIVFDCMDDAAEFPHVKNNLQLRERILDDEKQLLQKASIVFCSAEYLKNKIIERSGVFRNDVLVVNNALELPQDNDTKEIPDNIKDLVVKMKNLSKPLLYIGTIDAWFDFDNVLKALDTIQDLNLVLLGPIRAMLPNHERIHYFGTVDRKYLFAIMPHAYALVMPFKLNELIKSVNPVKLYEYIYTGKPIIATKYGETEKFSEFVALYSDSDDFIDIIRRLDNSNVDENYLNKCRNYVSQNTWKSRYGIIKQQLTK